MHWRHKCMIVLYNIIECVKCVDCVLNQYKSIDYFIYHICLPGEKTCSACSCSVSLYSKSALSIYRLTCGHLLCGSCLRRESQPLNSVTASSSNQILCPACQSPSPRSDITRVHHWLKLLKACEEMWRIFLKVKTGLHSWSSVATMLNLKWKKNI